MTSTSFSPFDLIVCVQVDYILRLDRLRTAYSGAFSLASLEAKTKSAFNVTVEDIYLSYKDEHFPFAWRLAEEKVLFYNVNNSLARCFQVEIEQESPRYRKVFSASKLSVLFKHPFYSLLVLAKGQHFSTGQHPYGKNNERAFFNKISTKFKKCRQYDELNSNLNGCKSRQNCLDQCLIRKSVEQNLNISANFVIDKSLFTGRQWASLFVDQADSSMIRKRIESECKQAFALPDCSEVFFKQHRPSTNWKLMQIDVSYLLIELIEGQNVFQFIQELLLLQCVVFNFNVFQMAILFILFKFSLLQNRLGLYLIYAVCLSGFVGHNWMVLYELRNERLVQSQIFKELQVFQMPIVAFCFDYNQSALGHSQTGNLTGNDLERLTGDINPAEVFREIAFVDRSNKEIRIDFSRALNSTKEFCQVKTFYFLIKKCLAIHLEISYEKYAQFYFGDKQTSVVLKVNFNRPFIESHKVISFLTKKKNRLHLSRSNELDYSDPTKSYLAQQTVVGYYYADKFRLFKQLLSLFKSLQFESYPNVDDYLAELRQSFLTKHNASTLDLPLEQQDFHLKINSTLFREHYYREHYPNDRRLPDDLVYQNEQAVHSVYAISDQWMPNFQFGFRKLSFVHVNRSENQLCKTILTFLNGLCFWLNIRMFRTFFLS